MRTVGPDSELATDQLIQWFAFAWPWTASYAPVSELDTDQGYYYSPSPAMDTPMFTHYPSKGTIAGYLYVYLLPQPFLGLPYTGYDRMHESTGLGLPHPPSQTLMDGKTRPLAL